MCYMQKDLSALQQQQQFNFCRQVNSNAERTLRENLMINGKMGGGGLVGWMGRSVDKLLLHSLLRIFLCGIVIVLVAFAFAAVVLHCLQLSLCVAAHTYRSQREATTENALGEIIYLNLIDF